MDDRCTYAWMAKEPFRCDLRQTQVKPTYCRDDCKLYFRRDLFRDMKAGAWHYIKIIDNTKEITPQNLSLDLQSIFDEPVNEDMITALGHSFSSYHNTSKYLVAMPGMAAVTQAYAELTNKKIRQLDIHVCERTDSDVFGPLPLEISLDKPIPPDELTSLIGGYVNTGGMILGALTYLKNQGVYIHSAYAVVDAENGARALIEPENFFILSLMTMAELIEDEIEQPEPTKLAQTNL